MLKDRENFREILEHSPTLIYGLLPDGTLEFTNLLFEKHTGFTFQELADDHWLETLKWEDACPPGQNFVDWLLQKGPLELCDSVLYSRDGQRLDIAWNYLPILDRDNKLQLMIGFGVDVTGRQRAGDQARRARDDWEKVFDAIGDIVTIQDVDMRITRVNQAACVALSAQEDELIGKTCYKVFRGESAPCPDCPEVNTLSDRKPHCGEIEHVNLERQFLVSASPIFEATGEFSGIIHIARDITDKKMLEAQLRQAQKMEAIGTLAGGIAHDFNNVLGAILGYTDLILMECTDGATRDNLGEIKKAGLRAKDLVGQILTFSRQQEAARKPLIISSLVKETVRLLRASLPSTIEVNLQISAPESKIMGDSIQIHQVLLNLCANAQQAMDGGHGVLDIVLEDIELPREKEKGNNLLPKGSYVQLTVRDTGAGMDEYTRQRIFEPFFSTRERGAGSGMGLSVAHGIIRSYGGDITVESSPGQGATFTILIPKIDSKAETSVSQVAAVPAGGNERVLFVDDEQSLALMGQRMLSFLGYRVEATSSSVEALDMIKSDPDGFDLVITDYTMPQMTGGDLAAEILKIRPDLPIILCTGFSEEVTEKRVKGLGIRQLIMKPLSIHELAAVIREVLSGG